MLLIHAFMKIVNIFCVLSQVLLIHAFIICKDPPGANSENIFAEYISIMDTEPEGVQDLGYFYFSSTHYTQKAIVEKNQNTILFLTLLLKLQEGHIIENCEIWH